MEKRGSRTLGSGNCAVSQAFIPGPSSWGMRPNTFTARVPPYPMLAHAKHQGAYSERKVPTRKPRTWAQLRVTSSQSN